MAGSGKRTTGKGGGGAPTTYEPTAKQAAKWAAFDAKVSKIPTDAEFKEIWKASHHGKERGWGMGKANWVQQNMKHSTEYQTGIWQGRVDALQGRGYTVSRGEKPFNLGYYRGFTNWGSDRRGLDPNQRATFEAKYGNG